MLDPELAGPKDATGPPSAEGRPSAILPPAPVPLEPRGDGPEPLVFRQGAHPPFGIRWYGVTSLFGHLRNFVARAIATESVDSRDWMRPAAARELLGATTSTLAAPIAPPAAAPASLTCALGRPVWIDFVADTGDDRDVSAGVGALLAATYDVAEGDGRRVLPRGDILLFGGDVAYPVATADEIYKRLVLPWNEQLRNVGASADRRVVLGVPGNHDWYDGLDGFGRLFRRRIDEPFRADDRDTTPKLGKRLRKRAGRKVGLVARQLHLDEVGGLYGGVVAFIRSVRAFFRGVGIKRRRRLVLRGYEPVQEASYFALPLTPKLDLWGADRQLGRVDFRQRAFFHHRRREAPDVAVFFVAGDPAYAYGVRNDPGARMLSACRLSMERDAILYLAGDFHHYERRKIGRSTHVIAGGGGAFLHGTRMAPYPAETGAPDAVYPGPSASRRLALQVPWKLMYGRAGALVHIALALLATLELAASRSGSAASVSTGVVVSLLMILVLYFVAHQGHGKRRIFLLSIPFGTALGLMPMLLQLPLPRLPWHAGDGAVIVATAFVGALVFGIYLTALAVLGLEHQQAFTVLGHPGFKHFVRLCVHPEGRVEAWTIGKDDMLDGTPPKLIDQFSWTPSETPRQSKRPRR